MFLDVAAVHMKRLRLFDLILDNWINIFLLPDLLTMGSTDKNKTEDLSLLEVGLLTSDIESHSLLDVIY